MVTLIDLAIWSYDSSWILSLSPWSYSLTSAIGFPGGTYREISTACGAMMLLAWSNCFRKRQRLNSISFHSTYLINKVAIFCTARGQTQGGQCKKPSD